MKKSVWRLERNAVPALSPDILTSGSLQLRADKQFKTRNGPLDCVQKNYHIAETTADGKPATVAEDYANACVKS